MKNVIPQIVCFGEILWDNLPSGKKAGGAPMNVAYHLKKLGMESKLISRVGDDPSGAELLGIIGCLGLSTSLCQIDRNYQTSEVKATIQANNEVKYDILAPVAWDFIESNTVDEAEVKSADVFVFGTLAARNDQSRQTLNRLLDLATYKVMDINLRPPHFTQNTIDQLLPRVDLLKLNEEELNIISSGQGDTEAQKVVFLQNRYGLPEIIVTKGDQGASYYSLKESYTSEAYKVSVSDTVGSGDSFLAGFLAKRLASRSIQESLDFACQIGAFISTHAGACPPYLLSDLERFIHRQGVTIHIQSKNQSTNY